MSCSYCARSTHSTSSNSRSSWFVGVSRCRLRSGRWTMTLRSLPTSEWTPSPVMSLRSDASSGHDLGPGDPVDELLDVRQRADRRTPTCALDEAHRGLDLGSHRAGRESHGSQLVHRHGVQPVLLRRRPVDVDAVDIRHHHVGVGVDTDSEALTREVLVDDGLNAHEATYSLW